MTKRMDQEYTAGNTSMGGSTRAWIYSVTKLPRACKNSIALRLKSLHLPELTISLYITDLVVYNLSCDIKNDINDTPIT